MVDREDYFEILRQLEKKPQSNQRDLATQLGVSKDDLMTAMEMARKDKSMTVTLALQQMGATSATTKPIAKIAVTIPVFR